MSHRRWVAGCIGSVLQRRTNPWLCCLFLIELFHDMSNDQLSINYWSWCRLCANLRHCAQYTAVCFLDRFQCGTSFVDRVLSSDILSILDVIVFFLSIVVRRRRSDLLGAIPSSETNHQRRKHCTAPSWMM